MKEYTVKKRVKMKGTEIGSADKMEYGEQRKA